MNNEKTVFKFKNNFKHFKIFLVLLIIIIIIIAIFFIINQNKNNDKDKKILYTINYNGLDCPTPTLVLYDNYTYAYHYTFTTDNKKTTPKLVNITITSTILSKTLIITNNLSKAPISSLTNTIILI